MNLSRLLPLFIVLTSFVSAVELRVASLNVGAHFGETYFDYGIGDVTTEDHQSVRAVLGRIDADVVALQEIHSADVAGSPNDLEDLAAFLGYPHVHVAGTSGAFDNTFRVVVLSRYPFVSAADIQSPAGARELTRLHPVVKVDVPGTENDPVIVSVHLKSETGLAERFRRAVEMKRLVGHLADAGLGDGDNFIVFGDFNPSSVDATFAALPAGLPGSYVLGGDLAFPIDYSTDPLAYFSAPGAARIDLRQLDGSQSTYGTAAPGGPALDMILVSPAIAARPLVAEIYNSALDVSNGGGLAKAGSPLADTTSAVASDHYAVFADVNLDNAGPYTFTAPGQTVVEDFSGFQGNNDPAPWVTGGTSAWLGVDDGNSGMPGLRSYGTAADGSLGFLGGGEVATAGFVNASGGSLTALHVAMDIEQWRAAMDGAADAIQVDLVTDSGTIPLPGLTFASSQSLPAGPVAGGVTTTLEAVASGLAIAPGAAFGLRVSWVSGASGGVASSDVFVNEFHYDNARGDSGEFVEIAVAPGFGGSVSDILLVIYNGSNGGAIGAHWLDSFTPGATTASGHRLFYKAIPGLQNDSEGFAVVAGASVLHFISYEGAFTATDGPAAGMVSSDVGVFQTTGEMAGEASLGLAGTGTGAGAADFTWTKFTDIPHSPGQPNSGQTFAADYLPPQGLAIDHLRVTFLTDSDLDGLPDLSDADDDNDGQSDAYEAAFGSDPLNAASRFVPLIERSAGGVALVFPGAVGVSYVVETSGDLSVWEEHSVRAGNGETIVLPLPEGKTRMFFRVRAGG